MNPHFTWGVIFLMYCLILFSNTLLIIFIRVCFSRNVLVKLISLGLQRQHKRKWIWKTLSHTFFSLRHFILFTSKDLWAMRCLPSCLFLRLLITSITILTCMKLYSLSVSQRIWLFQLHFLKCWHKVIYNVPLLSF